MKIEDQVVSLKVAKKLQPYLPKGFKSYLSYRSKKEDNFAIYDLTKIEYYDRNLYDFLCAVTLTEVLGLLPAWITIKGETYCRMIRAHFQIYYKSIKSKNKTPIYNIREDGNPTNAAAKLFMRLVDNGHIEVKK